jgi:purine-nucleoside phosphorylase
MCHDVFMYKELTATDARKMLGVSEDYTVEALLTFGSHPKEKEYPFFEEALRAHGIEPIYETIPNAFFGDIRSVVTPNGRLWFDVIYGSAYGSEIAHVASLLGARAIIHIGNTGGLQKDLKTGDIVVPSYADADDSAPRMYARPETEQSFPVDTELSERLATNIGAPTDRRPVISIQAMLAETREDVAVWEKGGYAGVDLECATIFAVANHFNIPVAAAVYVADNLANESLVTDAGYAASRGHRQEAKHRVYAAAIKTLLENR